MNYCPNCGRDVKGANYCPNCGASLFSNVRPPYREKTDNSKEYPNLSGADIVVDAVKKFWLRAFDFEGRTSRPYFWWAILMCFVLSAIPGIGLLIMVPLVAITIRRLHDVGKSGAYCFWALVPFVGWIMLSIMCAGSGDSFINEYGEPQENNF